jgi:multimeric flavodoxin WrbA
MTITVVGVVGSMRPHGNTEATVRAALAGAAESAGVTTEAICLRQHRIEFCRGCYEIHGRPERKCAIDDDMTELYARLSAADAYIFASPAYFGGMTGLLRTFFDRSGPLWGRLTDKPAGIIALGEDRFGGQELVAEAINVFCRAQRLRVVGWPLCLQTPAGDRAGSIAGDAAAMGAAAELGRTLVAAVKKARGEA